MYSRDVLKCCTYINFRLTLILLVIDGMISFQVLANTDNFTHIVGSPTSTEQFDVANRSKDDIGGVNSNLNLAGNVDTQRTRDKRRAVSGGLPATVDEMHPLDTVDESQTDSNNMDSNEIVLDLQDEEPSPSTTSQNAQVSNVTDNNEIVLDLQDEEPSTTSQNAQVSNVTDNNEIVLDLQDEEPSTTTQNAQVSNVTDNNEIVLDLQDEEPSPSTTTQNAQVSNVTDNNEIVLDLQDEEPSPSTTTQNPWTIIGNAVDVPDSRNDTGDAEREPEVRIDNGTIHGGIIHILSGRSRTSLQSRNGSRIYIPESADDKEGGNENQFHGGPDAQVDNGTDSNEIILDLSDEDPSKLTTTQWPWTVIGNGKDFKNRASEENENESDEIPEVQIDNDTIQEGTINNLSGRSRARPSTRPSNKVNFGNFENGTVNEKRNESDGKPEVIVENDVNLITLDLPEEDRSPSTPTQRPSTAIGSAVNVPDAANNFVNGKRNESDGMPEVVVENDVNLITLDLAEEDPSPSTTTQKSLAILDNVANVPDSGNGSENGKRNESDGIPEVIVDDSLGNNLITLDLSHEVEGPSSSTTTQRPSTTMGNTVNVPDAGNGGTRDRRGNESDGMPEVIVENDVNLITLDLSDEDPSPSTMTKRPSNVPNSGNGTVNGSGNESYRTPGVQVENATDNNGISLDLPDEDSGSPITTELSPTTISNWVNVENPANGNSSSERPEVQIANYTTQGGITDDLLGSSLIALTTTQMHSTGIGNSVSVSNPENFAEDGKKKESYSRPEVQIENGTIRGGIIEIDSGEVFVFYGIPYAAPPVDKLRFKPPFPADPISGTFDAITIKPPCFPSRHERTSKSAAYSKPETGPDSIPVAGEDCLYLNVWLPSTVLATEQLPMSVLVFLNGEGFLSGRDEEDYDSVAWFVKRSEVIVVAIQYRQGVFGFLHMGVPEVPGNMGLLDQIQAMNWIEQNIEGFGGNPNAVTIMGHDIGASFVGFHLLSNSTPNCFNRAIMLGGTPTQPHVFKPREEAYQASIEFAAALCNSTNSSQSILNCLVELEAFAIWEVQSSFTPTGYNALEHSFVPTNDGIVLETSPFELLKSGNGKFTEILIGGTSNEGSSLMLEKVEKIHPERPTFICQNNFESILGQVFRNFSDMEMKLVSHEYKNWGNLDDGYANQRRIAEIFGDYYFTCPIRKFAELWFTRNLTTYYYAFSHRSTALKRPHWMGAAHGDEIDFLFGVPIRLPSKFTKRERDLSTKAMNVLVSFIKTGMLETQTPRDKSGKEKPQNENFQVTSSNQFLGPRRKTCDFWNEIFPLMKKFQRCMEN